MIKSVLNHNQSLKYYKLFTISFESHRRASILLVLYLHLDPFNKYNQIAYQLNFHLQRKAMNNMHMDYDMYSHSQTTYD